MEDSSCRTPNKRAQKQTKHHKKNPPAHSYKKSLQRNTKNTHKTTTNEHGLVVLCVVVFDCVYLCVFAFGLCVLFVVVFIQTTFFAITFFNHFFIQSPCQLLVESIKKTHKERHPRKNKTQQENNWYSLCVCCVCGCWFQCVCVLCVCMWLLFLGCVRWFFVCVCLCCFSNHFLELLSRLNFSITFQQSESSR